MNRYELADALMYISELIQRAREEESQLSNAEIDELDSAQSMIEEVALGIKVEERLEEAGGLWIWS